MRPVTVEQRIVDPRHEITETLVCRPRYWVAAELANRRDVTRHARLAIFTREVLRPPNGGFMPVDKIALSDKLTIVVDHVDGGKIRATSLAWADPHVLKPDQILEVRAMGAGGGWPRRTAPPTMTTAP
jgi:hypothetical protein